MKTADERMAQVLQRFKAARVRQRLRRQRLAVWGGSAACAVILAVASLAVSPAGLSGSVASFSVGESGLAASVFADSPMLGYLIVGLLGALLGIALTVLVYRLGNRDGELESTRDGMESVGIRLGEESLPEQSLSNIESLDVGLRTAHSPLKDAAGNSPEWGRRE